MFRLTRWPSWALRKNWSTLLGAAVCLPGPFWPPRSSYNTLTRQSGRATSPKMAGFSQAWGAHAAHSGTLLEQCSRVIPNLQVGCSQGRWWAAQAGAPAARPCRRPLAPAAQVDVASLLGSWSSARAPASIRRWRRDCPTSCLRRKRQRLGPARRLAAAAPAAAAGAPAQRMQGGSCCRRQRTAYLFCSGLTLPSLACRWSCRSGCKDISTAL